MADFNFTKIIPVVVVLIVALAAVAPAVSSMMTKTEAVTTEVVYGDNSLDPYTEVISSTTRGDVEHAYTITRGNLYVTGSGGEFTEDANGNTIRVSGNISLALESHQIYVEPVELVYATINGAWAGLMTSPASNQPAVGQFSSLDTSQDFEVYLETDVSSIDGGLLEVQEVTRSPGYTPVTEGVELFLPYQASYTVPVETLYTNNTINSTTISSQYGTMSGTTFTPDASGDWLQIPLYIFQNSPANTYKVLGGATFYAPDTNGDLAAFTAASGTISGTATGLTITFTQDTSITSATVYNMAISAADGDLPGIIISRDVYSITPISVKAVYSAGSSNTSNVQSYYALTSAGDLYVKGKNSSGNLGLGNTTDQSDWVFSRANVSNVYTSLGYFGGYTVFIEDAISGDIYVAGANNLHQGSPSYASSISTWQKTIDSPVTKVVTGYQASFYISAGDVYAIGSVSSGAFGSANTYYTTWTKIYSGGDAVDIAIAHGNSKDTTYILTNTGVLLGSGDNTYGQLGLGDTTKRTSFEQLATGVAEIRAGAEYSGIVAAYCDSSENLYVAGLYHTSTWALLSANVSEFSVNEKNIYYLDTDGYLHLDSSGNVQTSSNSGWEDLCVGGPGYYAIVSDGNNLYMTRMYGYEPTYQQSNVTAWKSYAYSGYAQYLVDSNSSLFKLNTGTMQFQADNTLGQRTTIYTNQTESKTISDYRCDWNGTQENPNGEYLLIPIQNAVNYTYYISQGSAYKAPATTFTTQGTAPIVASALNPAVTLTFTQLSGYGGEVYSMDVSTTDMEVGDGIFSIPYAVYYTATVSQTVSNWTGVSSEYVFTENANGLFIQIPVQILYDTPYYIDDGATYYALSGDYLAGYTAPDTTGLSGIDITFTADAELEDVYDISTTSTSGYIIIPVDYGAGGTNPNGAVSETYTPVRGTISEGAFTESATGDYIRIAGPQAMHDTYVVASGATYYLGDRPTATADAPGTPTGVQATLVFTTNTTDSNVYDVVATAMGDGYSLFIPYTVTYEKTEMVTTELIPMGGLLVMAIILVSLVLTVSLLAGRRDY